MRLERHHIVLWAVFIIGMLMMPMFVPNGDLRIMARACYLAIFAISWDVLSGRTGYVSFGHPFLIGIGAYTTAILSKKLGVPVALSIPIAVAMTMVGGLIVLLPALRIRGSYFALVTLAYMELMYQLMQVVRPDLTGGTRGISGIQGLTRGAANGYYLAVSLMLAIALAMWLLMRTRLGTALWAVGMNEESVRGSGLSVTRLKAVAFLASAFVAGIGGAFLVHYNGSVSPRGLFEIDFLFTIIVAALIGGAGSIIGPIIGAFFLTFLLEYLRPVLPGAERFFVYGAVALLLYMYQPRGIYAMIQQLWARVRA